MSKLIIVFNITVFFPAARKAFETKRKAHYNEFYAAKMARKLIKDEDEEDEDHDSEETEQNVINSRTAN